MIKEEILLAHAVFRNVDMTVATGLSPSAVSRALQRYRASGILVQVSRGIWAAPQHPHFSIFGVVPHLLAREQGYISCLSALQRHGLLSQLPPQVYVVTTGHTRRLASPIGEYRFLQMKPRYLQHGVVWHDGATPYAIATAEKALLDCLYISTRRGMQFQHLPELDLQAFSHQQFTRLLRLHAYPAAVHSAIERYYARLRATV